ncbi:hypothetical protein [Priestia megaterium]|uniref:hypothetical protein n=1 Tax=Priestia megaterium TaxID=1404 RepID=UPI00273119B5|nr:hypothetical protein [Priestia megaterium]MDP1442605.1 hypothetical protein [Priestia megaterium]MDP1471558.1 hypothetical protein [Priestia megaterium]MDR0132171.1 hypothetical protein [Priestia megaterium]MDR4221800.1 hypothetical protein [Priestia megaterium]
MTGQRIDTIDSYFQKVSNANKWTNLLFWFTVVCSIIILFTDRQPTINNVINIIFIVATFGYFVFSNWLSLFLLREAQNKRRIHLLSNSLGVRLDDEHTNMYYNNSEEPSIIRLSINVFENSLFTWRVTEEMLKKERIKVLSYVLIWLLLVLIRDINLNFIAVIAQTLFTTGLLINYIKLELLRSSCCQVFNEFRQIFLNNGSSISKEVTATLLSLVFRYETAVASMGIHLSSTTFHNINPTVTQEWERVKENVNL